MKTDLLLKSEYNDATNSSSMQTYSRHPSITCRDGGGAITEDLLADSESNCNSRSSPSPFNAFNHNPDRCSVIVNGLGFGENENTLERLESCASLSRQHIFEENHNSLEHIDAYPLLTMLDSGIGLNLKEDRTISKESRTTLKICASNLSRSSSSPSDISFTSTGESSCTAISFANQCLVRSYERRSLSNYTLLYASSYSTNLSYESSSRSLSSHSIDSMATAQSVEKLLFDVSISSFREYEIKRELRMMKEKYYGQKCTQILKKSKTNYNKRNAIRDSKNLNEENSSLISYGCEFYNETYTVLFEAIYLRCNR